MTSTEVLMTAIRDRYNAFDAEGVEAIDTSLLAESVYETLDPESDSPLLVKFAAVLELKQLARSICRDRQSLAERDAEQDGLFEFQLQPRYPAARNGRDMYVLRHCLSVVERKKNIQRLRSEATAKNNHADALAAETDDLIRQGLLSVSEAVTVA